MVFPAGSDPGAPDFVVQGLINMRLCTHRLHIPKFRTVRFSVYVPNCRTGPWDFVYMEVTVCNYRTQEFSKSYYRIELGASLCVER